MSSQLQFVIDANAEHVDHKKYSKDVVYEILNYNPNNVTTDASIYRSIVVDPETKEVFSFAPPKSIDVDTFRETFSDLRHDRFQMNEIVEGTMMNLFYDHRINQWEIATKGAIGGTYWYYRNTYEDIGKAQLTFRQMFLEALGCDKDTPFSDIALLNNLMRDHVYSFVVQHPDNHIVLNIVQPAAYLVCVFQKVSQNTLQMVPLKVIRSLSLFQNSPVHFPRDVDPERKTFDILSSEDSNHIYPGYMILDEETGMRTKIENPNYVKLKTIRGNNPNLLYHYLCFTHADQCRQFLEHFPMYAQMFGQFQKQVNTLIRHIHDAYVLYYVQKRGKQIRIPAHIMPHIWKLHFETHLPSIERGEKQIITKDVVRQYFNNMLPKEKWYYLNQCANQKVAEEYVGK